MITEDKSLSQRDISGDLFPFFSFCLVQYAVSTLEIFSFP